jgi:hypothetical protein
MDQAHKQAVQIVSATRKSARELRVEASEPFFKGMAVLADASLVRLERGDGEHDLRIHLTSLAKRSRVVVRTKRTRVLKKWLARPGARLVAGCGLTDGDSLTLWVEFPAPPKRREGPILGVDVGVSKLLATSDGKLHGTEFRSIRDKVRRRRPGSKGRRRARRERDQLIFRVTKQLPWSEVRAIAFEDLAGIKFGKKRGRGRGFRRALAAWRATLVDARLVALAAEHGVHAVRVPAWGNSTTCPACRTRNRKNRRGDLFECVTCRFTADADHVGALAAQRLGEKLLPEAARAWEHECDIANAARERRKAAAKKRGEATAAKWRRKRAVAANAEEATKDRRTNDSSSRGAQSPAARALHGCAPIRDQGVGGAPQNVGAQSPAEEKPEGGSRRGSRLEAAGRRGAEPPTPDPSLPREQLPSCDVVGSWQLDEFADKP